MGLCPHKLGNSKEGGTRIPQVGLQGMAGCVRSSRAHGLGPGLERQGPASAEAAQVEERGMLRKNLGAKTQV
jgi:hypothetical protein